MSTRSITFALLLTLLASCAREDSATPGGPGETMADSPREEASAAPSPATDGNQPCAGADTGLGEARRNEYPALVADAVDGATSPSSVEIASFMEIDAWSAVFAVTPIADPGWFVFESTNGQKRFKDVWAGMAVESDRPGLVQWAIALGAPMDFAACFAETVVN